MAIVMQAMARHELREADAARDVLAEAAALIDPALEEFQPDVLPNGWHDWLIADVLRREAEGLMGEEEER